MQRDLKPVAVDLRKKGLTFQEIQARIGSIPKSTLSNWLKNIELTDTQKKRIAIKITDRGVAGRQKGAWKNHQNRLERISTIQIAAAEEYKKFTTIEGFRTGLVLYLAEGSKKSEMFQFMNSDPMLIKIMLNWVQTFGQVSLKHIRYRLYIHNSYKHENCETFWISKINIPTGQLQKTIYKPTPRTYKKSPNYMGCLRFDLPGSELYWKTMAWRDCLYREID